VALRDRLGRARAAVSGAVAGALGRGIDDAAWEAVEEALLRADLGVATTRRVLGTLRTKVESHDLDGPAGLVAALREEMAQQLAGSDRAMRIGGTKPSIWLVVGVNGAGKTTTIGKLAAQQVAAGRTVVLAAGDTFRAAAGEQLAEWARRTGSDLVRGADGGDPSAVVFDAVLRAAARGADLVIADTAGRLQSNANLMEELRKVRRVAGKGPGEVAEVLLVIDATTGQNGLVQAREFTEAAGVTGVALTKLDGSAKGGIAFAIESELGIPIKVVGIGEQVDDLVPFDPTEFVAALFDE
jgi:fused signal recognition particle receptor